MSLKRDSRGGILMPDGDRFDVDLKSWLVMATVLFLLSMI